ncbi:metal-dependent hydrolase [Protaetiibacter sp. SSC-01]|uniref:metal-dependent hydrolase n=1 Tax=Protaetiibacter sp. SSC-01 TaxID=2759943 RepID=UPI001656F1F9|nr:metal-dependent hydrolase [Protaetiibacter sp. SSC-01]QNO37432.1 metal-dependent hydrolase [Protaetiibacter sp. SSC-01]
MTLPSTDTRVSYPDGDTVSTGTVLHVEPLADGRSAVVLDRTAFHPVDTAWPDQPADRGRMRWGAAEAQIVGGVTGGIHDGELLLGRELPVRMGTPEWTFVVGHVIEGEAPEVGAEVEVSVDEGYRHALSAGHTGCHLASLALDAALAEAWTKAVSTDALGAPGFDAAAIQTSRIEEFGSTDVYRIGKSLRKKGFDVTALDDLDAVAARANAALAAWVASGASVRIERDGDAISARRTWVCALPDQEARIPCGGTHLAGLDAVEAITVALEATDVEGGRELRMRTTISLRG